jgi:hypothetical protein
MTRLSEHFTLEELSHSDTAVRLGIDNTPPGEIVPRLAISAQGMERVRSLLGHPITVHSGYRCQALERVLCERDFRAWCLRHGKDALGGAWAEYFARKAHPQGWAVDFTCQAFGTPVQIVGTIRRNGILFDQLIDEGATQTGGGWVHISFDPMMRREVLVARFDHNGVPSYAQS